ncbi:MAG: hypothetical protein WDW36_005821 [Sanguina aurantia]
MKTSCRTHSEGGRAGTVDPQAQAGVPSPDQPDHTQHPPLNLTEQQHSQPSTKGLAQPQPQPSQQPPPTSTDLHNAAATTSKSAAEPLHAQPSLQPHHSTVFGGLIPSMFMGSPMRTAPQPQTAPGQSPQLQQQPGSVLPAIHLPSHPNPLDACLLTLSSAGPAPEQPPAVQNLTDACASRLTAPAEAAEPEQQEEAAAAAAAAAAAEELPQRAQSTSTGEGDVAKVDTNPPGLTGQEAAAAAATAAVPLPLS